MVGCTVKICSSMLKYILDKFSYVKCHFNMQSCLMIFFANDLLLAFLKIFYTMHVCSWYWSKERVQFFSMALSDHTSHNQCFKSQELGYEVSALSTISTHQQNAISSNILITFFREKISTSNRTDKILSKSY